MTNHRIWSVASIFTIFAMTAAPVVAQNLRPDQVRFRALYKELVETNTTLSAGDCTLAARKMAVHLKAAGYPDADVHFFGVPEHPKEGGLVAVLHGGNRKAKAILLLGHLDVVEARREDWARDPFALVEENGFFYGRGTLDMKAQVASWVDTMIRLKEEGFKHSRDIKMALTCGEETSTAFNGASYLASHERELIDADFALTEGGGGGRLDSGGKRLALTIKVAEKYPQDYQLEVTNPGGHSSRPVPDNAIYRLAAGLLKISAYQFPFQPSDLNRAFFGNLAPQVGGEMGKAMTAFASGDMSAAATIATDTTYNAMLRTTCVATLLSAGHANNALPQRADANINCRIFPGTSVEQVRAKLEELVADPEIKVTVNGKRSEVLKGMQPLTPEVLNPVEMVAAKMWPGVPVVPFLDPGATDAAFLAPTGIPTYGITGTFIDPGNAGAHGLNEHIRVRSVYEGRDFLYQLVKIYANQK